MEELSERKKKILQALVDSYIDTAVPVSSNDIKNSYLPEISSATIRSELANLEDMGYLLQPHISAGRVPSSKGYMLYVNSLMQEKVDTQDLKTLDKNFSNQVKKIEEIVRETAKIISDVTNYTSVILLNKGEDITFESIKMLQINETKALLVVVTDNDIYKDSVLDLPVGITENHLQTANKMLNDIFAGKKFSEVSNVEELINNEIDCLNNLFSEVLEVLKNMQQNTGKQVYLDGKNNIFNYPEYDSVDNIKNFLSVIEDNQKLRSIIDEDDDIEFSIKIGKECSKELNNMAIVTAKYSINGKEIGHAGVIGPERMDYKKVIKVLNQVSKTVYTLKDDNLNKK
ncbi:MAG: heat-inducible transcriptional repressor HrcA [Clostridia bacterium]